MALTWRSACERRAGPDLDRKASTMLLNRDQERWAAALWVEQKHGDAGTAYIAKQVERLVLKGDEAGVETWKTIGDRFDQLKCKSTAN